MLDLNTLRFISMVSFAGFTFATLTLWQLVPQEKSLRDWATSSILMTVAMLLLGLRGIIPDFFSIAIANTLIVLGVTFMHAGTRSLLGAGPGRNWHWLVAGTVFAICLTADLRVRVIATSLIYVPFFSSSAWLFWRNREKAFLKVAERLAAIIYTIGAAIFIYRALNPPSISGTAAFTTAPNWVEVLPYVFPILYCLWFSLLLMLIVSVRLQTQRAEALNRAEEAIAKLSESESRWNFALEGAGDGVWDWDVAAGKVTLSRRWFEIQGFDFNEIGPDIGDWEKLVHPDDLPNVRNALAAHIEGRTPNFSCEYQVRCKNGNYKWIHGRGMVVARDPDGSPVRIIGTHTDITDRKQVEQMLQEARDAAESLAYSKSEFLANMSHEIRTPMNGIIGLSKLALNKEVPADVRDYLSKINASSENLLGILNDILDFSKLEAGKYVVDNAPFHLGQVLENLRGLFSIKAEEKGLEFHMVQDPHIPGTLIGDALRIQQILSNLIGNAIKFTERGSVSIKSTLIASGNSQAQIRFCVRDSGIGIPKEHLDKLFEPFAQADTSITRRFGGTGLGLAISHGLLDRMGGTFKVESAPGEGTSFTFELQLGIASSDLNQAMSRRMEENNAGALSIDLQKHGLALRGKRILVAEDNLINQQVVKEFLKLSGIAVDIASNGLNALDLVRSNHYDAILMDVHMPEMGGVEATQHIRALPGFATLPIIALTAGVTEEERASCMAGGMTDFITKPIDPEELLACLTRWIDKR